jgi:hypothetical protein
MSFFKKKHPSASQLGSSATSTTTTAAAASGVGGAGGIQVQVAQTPSQALAQLKAAQSSEQMRDMGKENDACVIHLYLLSSLAGMDTDHRIDAIVAELVSPGADLYRNHNALKAGVLDLVLQRMLRQLRHNLHRHNNLQVPHLPQHRRNHDNSTHGLHAVSFFHHLLSFQNLA